MLLVVRPRGGVARGHRYKTLERCYPRTVHRRKRCLSRVEDPISSLQHCVVVVEWTQRETEARRKVPSAWFVRPVGAARLIFELHQLQQISWRTCRIPREAGVEVQRHELIVGIREWLFVIIAQSDIQCQPWRQLPVML